MVLKFNDERPIFIQIAEGIEDAILSGAFQEEGQIPSITEFAVTYRINPATALKGITILVEAEVLYKKRGVGMFVAKGAVQRLKEKRKKEFYDGFIKSLVEEARRLDISRDEIITLLERGYEDEH